MSSDKTSSAKQQDSRNKLLFVRLDRIGDLVLTLPVEESVVENGASNLPLVFSSDVSLKVDWWIPKGLKFVTDSASPKRNVREVAKTTDFNSFFSLVRVLRSERYRAAIVYHAPWWVGFALWLARIPLRAGVKSQWHSFLFFNRAIRQKRSRAEHSELEYNYQLTEDALAMKRGTLERKTLTLIPPDAPELLRKHGLASDEYSVVHPGMAGSARNWPTEKYAELVRELSAQEKVAITGTKADEPFVTPLKNSLKDLANVVWLDEQLSGPELLTVLGSARTITAPSTGVMHLAASLHRTTLGVFSPVRVQHPRRWGPQGPKTFVIFPEVDCPGTLSCLGEACPIFDCMKGLSSAKALDVLKPQ